MPYIGSMTTKGATGDSSGDAELIRSAGDGPGTPRARPASTGPGLADGPDSGTTVRRCAPPTQATPESGRAEPGEPAEFLSGLVAVSSASPERCDRSLPGQSAQELGGRPLSRRMAWELQARRCGGLDAATRGRLTQLAITLDPLGRPVGRAKRRRTRPENRKGEPGVRGPEPEGRVVRGTAITPDPRALQATDHAAAAASEHRAPRGRRKGNSRRRDLRLPAPGGLLRRTYKGRDILVRVLEDGYEQEGRRYRSLSAIAQAVTGAHWNGPLFFHLSPGLKPETGGGR